MQETSVPTELASSISKLQNTIEALKTELDTFLAAPLSNYLESSTPTDIANFELAIAFSINTLLYIKAKLTEESMIDHPILGELERLKSYFKKIKNLASKNSQAKNSQVASKFIINALE